MVFQQVPLQIQLRRIGCAPVCTLAFRGALDPATAPVVGEAILSHTSPREDLIVDLSDVDLVSAAVARTLAHARCRSTSGLRALGRV
ncbi:STAS domain-containing protein [Amycolatopsis sp. NPDC004378]